LTKINYKNKILNVENLNKSIEDEIFQKSSIDNNEELGYLYTAPNFYPKVKININDNNNNNNDKTKKIRFQNHLIQSEISNEKKKYDKNKNKIFHPFTYNKYELNDYHKTEASEEFERMLNILTQPPSSSLRRKARSNLPIVFRNIYTKKPIKSQCEILNPNRYDNKSIQVEDFFEEKANLNFVQSRTHFRGKKIELSKNIIISKQASTRKSFIQNRSTTMISNHILNDTK
jgi:hypothetical protein